eukprot:CAMPEP_0194482492 /NCGR_PEP_ID=MMETSP0253-20130528/4417_1 /TAXON_ID=2966 /ORGANISM="Noctiluca scintillans" /LENGTH=149 /DNA_ID=CAMNT_0039322033 /DNA_START=76 /DNA_END=522 /DNA_ORIENTATION=+
MSMFATALTWACLAVVTISSELRGAAMYTEAERMLSQNVREFDELQELDKMLMSVRGRYLESSVAPGRQFNRHSPTSFVQTQPAYASPETWSYLMPSGQVMFADPTNTTNTTNTTNSTSEVEQSADDVSMLESILTFGGLSYMWAGVVW